MKETRFIKQNKEKWTELEGVLKQSKKNPDELSELFVKVTDDLSYSRTFYPNRYVRVYLNNLAQRIFLSIYKNKRDQRSRFINFWKEELPLLVYQSRKEFLLSFLIFSLSVAIGIFSSIYDHDFARLILGDGYVEMTKEFIKSGDPMKVYKEQNGFDMLLGITINNLYVSFQTFIYGLFFTIATLGMLLYNGIMVGAFQYFFIERGLFWQSFLTIWMHGTLEISSIIIAGAAGIVLGKGLVFPETYSRLQSLQISAQRALKIFVGIAPIIVTAAIIESFITRITDVPDVLRLCVILFSLFFILAYFVWYPIQKSRSAKVPDEIRLPPDRNQQFDTTEIRNNGEIFGDIFIFLKKYFYQIIITALLIAATAATLIWFFNPGQWQSTFVFSRYQFLQVGEYFDYSFPVLFIVNTLAFAINILLVMRMVKTQIQNSSRVLETKPQSFKDFFLRNSYKVLIASLVINLVFFLPPPVQAIGVLLLFPLVCVGMFVMIYENCGPGAALLALRKFVNGTFWRMMGLQVLLALVSFILFFFLDSPALWLLIHFLKWNVMVDQQTLNNIYTFLMHFFTIFSMNLLLPLSFIGFSLQYFSLKEINDAAHLKERILLVGVKNGRA